MCNFQSHSSVVISWEFPSPWECNRNSLMTDKSTLVQVMAWCRQATSHCLSQWWPSSTPSYGITRPQWVKQNAMSSRDQWSFRGFAVFAGLWDMGSMCVVWSCYESLSGGVVHIPGHLEWLMGRLETNQLVQVMAWHLTGAKPSPEPMLTYNHLPAYEKLIYIQSKFKWIHSKNISEWYLFIFFAMLYHTEKCCNIIQKIFYSEYPIQICNVIRGSINIVYVWLISAYR